MSTFNVRTKGFTTCTFTTFQCAHYHTVNSKMKLPLELTLTLLSLVAYSWGVDLKFQCLPTPLELERAYTATV